MTRPGLRILVDGYWWVDGPPSNRHVLRETVHAWLEEFPHDRLVLMVPRADAPAVRQEMGHRVGVLTTPVWPHGLSNATALAAAAARWRPDVVYAQNFGVPTLGPGTLGVVFVHDVLWATNPEWFTRAELGYFSAMWPLAHAADLVLTSSATEADRIRRVTRARDVRPVGIGMSTELVNAVPTAPADAPVAGRYLLTVGRLNVRKNLATVMAAALASGVIGPDFPLLVVGAPDGKVEQLDADITRAVEAGSIRFTGYVSDAELAWLYRNTALFCFLTRGEGYGMPTAEAMAFGAPMIVSDIDVFREIVPPAIPRVAPDDVTGAARLIAAVVAGEQGAREPSFAAPDWPTTVARTRAALVERLSRRRRSR